uniref:Uncharacterized protein n=1 Tax=Lepeophtheirus salmonis TaxID=72036 RepID=A0A0K2TV98_LEPSM
MLQINKAFKTNKLQQCTLIEVASSTDIKTCTQHTFVKRHHQSIIKTGRFLDGRRRASRSVSINDRSLARCCTYSRSRISRSNRSWWIVRI